MKRTYLILLMLLIGACGQSAEREYELAPNKPEPLSAITDELTPSASYQEAYAAAVVAIDAAASKGHAWSTSDSLLKQAQTAAVDGNEERAIQLADQARVQGELAAQQADTEVAAWQEKVL